MLPGEESPARPMHEISGGIHVAEPIEASYGAWSSPISADVVLASALRLSDVQYDGERLCWLEGRPQEQGRYVVVQRSPGGVPVDAIPEAFNARTRVHEYGGGSYRAASGAVYFSHDLDRRLYRTEAGADPAPLTPAGAWRYADPVLDAGRQRLICVREDHTVAGREAENTIAAVGLDGCSEPVVLVRGADFYSNPRLSPDGTQLCWLAWNHPLMPWDGTELWVAGVLPDGSLGPAERVAGGAEESLFQPEWSPAGVLHYVSDRSGWWNLYRHVGAEEVALTPIEAELGLPQWVFGLTTYAFLDAERILCAYGLPGGWRLAVLHVATGRLEPLDLPYTSISSVCACGARAAFLGGAAGTPTSVVELDLESGTLEVVRQSAAVQDAHRPFLSVPRGIEFPTEGGLTAHAIYYPPANPRFRAPTGEHPPLLVKCHGGPTSAAGSSLALGIQFWTSRGFAVVDVNYGGSTGYGRAYRERLKDSWGIVDVDDCVNAALYLAREGLADEKRMAITGGSAGGYTTLCALAFRTVFSAGASHYGVSDLEGLALDTHKFESRYLDGLVGPYPERQDLYHARSALHHPEGISAPMAFFQGDEDAIVLPNQTERMVDALRARGIPVLYFLFEGEQHGFRKAENICLALEGELTFYAMMLLGVGLRY